MPSATLEHVNVTVTDPEATAHLLCALFDWRIRWQGASAMGGRTVHVGTDDAYVAVYTHDDTSNGAQPSSDISGGLNHIGIVVEDLAEAQRRIEAAGFAAHNHADYAPGRRFYFNDHDGIEYEVVSYSSSRRQQDV